MRNDERPRVNGDLGEDIAADAPAAIMDDE